MNIVQRIENASTKRLIWLFVIVGLIIYAASLFGPFIADDIGQIVNNPIVHSLRGIYQSFAGGSFSAAGKLLGTYYRPLPISIYSVLYSVFGSTPFVFHLLQLLLHITNTVLLFLILQQFFKKTPAFIVALLFLIHPLNTETVVYISNLQDVLFMFFGLASLCLLIKTKDDTKYNIRIYLLLFISLLSKETGFLFLLISLLYVYLFTSKNRLKHLLFLAITLSTYLFFRLVIAHTGFSGSPITPIAAASFHTRLITMPAVLVYYLQTFFYPNHLLAIQSWIITQVDIRNFLIPLIEFILFLGAILSGGVWIYQNQKNDIKTYLFFVFWFLCGLFFHSQLKALDVTASDRFFYFPIIGLLGIIAILVSNVKLKPVQWRSLAILGMVVFILLSVRTVIRTTNWNNTLTLLNHDVSYAKRKDYLLYSAYGGELLAVGKNDDAFYYLNEAVKLYPKNFLTWNNLGLIYYKKGDLVDAKEAFLTSIKNGGYFGAYENLSLLLLNDKDNLKEAKKFIDYARLQYPLSTRLLYAQIVAEYMTGDKQGAMASAWDLFNAYPNQETAHIYSTVQKGQEVHFDLGL